MSLLNLENLYSDQEKRRARKHQVYDVILKQCHRKIEQVNQKLKLYECYYQIPTYIFGYPTYDLEQASSYLQKRLGKNGLLVYPMNQRMLYISWKPDDIDFDRYQRNLKKEADRSKYQVRTSDVLDNNNDLPQLNSNPLPDGHPGTKRSRGKKSGQISMDKNSGQGGKVSMIQYDQNIDDVIPVNTKKIHAQDQSDKFAWS